MSFLGDCLEFVDERLLFGKRLAAFARGVRGARRLVRLSDPRVSLGVGSVRQ